MGSPEKRAMRRWAKVAAEDRRKKPLEKYLREQDDEEAFRVGQAKRGWRLAWFGKGKDR